MSNDKTIKQIADELGIDKQRVYRFITRNHITASNEVMQTKYYDDAAQVLIKSALEHITTSKNRNGELHHEAPLKSGQDLMLETLIKELEIKNRQLDTKDEQLKELNNRLAETTSALVTAQQTVQAAQALHAGTIRQQIESGDSDPAESIIMSPKKQSFFARLFTKNSTKE